MKTNIILNGDALTHLKELPSCEINMCMTSPPYWALRDYGVEGQLGLEPTFEEYINKLCDIFDEVKRVLKDDGTCWVNLGDSYNNFGWAGNKKGKYNNQPINKSNETHGRGGVKAYWDGKNFVQEIKTRKRYCCECGKIFDALPNQYFCGSACSGVDNTPRNLKGKFPDKTLVMIPFRFAIEMVNRGWILRNTIIWHKRNCMPSSVKDRFTVDFEYLFFFSKKKKYYFETQYENRITEPIKDLERIKNQRVGNNKHNQGGVMAYKNTLSDEEILKQAQQGRNKRTVWSINPKPFKEAHFAVYPEELCETPLKAGCPEGGIVLDPFFGAGTTGLVSLKLNRQFIGIELNPEYVKIAQTRIKPFLEQTKLNLKGSQ